MSLRRKSTSRSCNEPTTDPSEETSADGDAQDMTRTAYESERLALAIEGSGTGIWDRNVQTDEIYYSTDWKAMLGFKEDEVSGRMAESYTRVHPDDIAYVKRTIQDHFDRKTPYYEVEHRLRCKDGSYKWVCSRGKVVSRDSEGNPLRMVGTTTDVTSMHEISEQLHNTVQLLTSLTNEVPGLVFQYHLQPDGRGRFSYASAGIEDIYELSPLDVADSAAVLDRLIHPEDLYSYHASLRTSAACLAPWHCEYRVILPRQGLRWRQGDAKPQRLDDGSTLWHGFITDITARKNIEAELHKFATTDFLTQLANRRHFMVQVEAELARLRHDKSRPAAILMIDLDHFKAINDRWGHALGDKALRHFSAVLSNHLRETDVAGRIGGEEFAVMLRAAGFTQAESFAQRLQRHLRGSPLIEDGQHVDMTVSVGISVMSPDDATADDSIFRSDRALYQAKDRGRDRIERA